MIVCPNCDHQNPEGASQCEACYTPLPSKTYCPNCGAEVQTDSTFCGQCGYSIQAEAEIEPLTSNEAEFETLSPPLGATIQSLPPQSSPSIPSSPPLTTPNPPTTLDVNPEAVKATTRLQVFAPSLLHLQTNTKLEVPQGLPVVHIGKPNEQIPPDIDVSGFPDSDIVSRIHADIRVEGDMYYLEDNGSSNGTYVNHIPLTAGDRHRLRSGDRISLGKGDKVTFIFQLG